MLSLSRRALSRAVAAIAVLTAVPAFAADAPTPAAAPAAALVKAANDLGLKALGEQIAAAPQANHAFSPLSLAGALALLAQGEGKLTATLGATTAEALAADWKALSDAAKPAADKKLAFSLAGGLWHAPALTVDGGVAKRLKDDMAATAAGLDFADPKAVDSVNAWVKTATAGMIPTLFDRFPPNTEMALVSALAFKADWATAFDPKDTQNLPFTAADGKTTEVPTMMRADAGFLHLGHDGNEAVLLPYADPAFALALALPAAGKPPAGLFVAGASGWLDSQAYAPRPGHIQLPRVDLSPRYDLTDPKSAPTLAKLLGGPRDLSGLGAAWKDKPQTLSQAVQATALRWDEAGTQAAAATGFAVTRSMTIDSDGPFNLRFDQPFAFALLHRPSGAILLAGVVNTPKP